MNTIHAGIENVKLELNMNSNMVCIVFPKQAQESFETKLYKKKPNEIVISKTIHLFRVDL